MIPSRRSRVGLRALGLVGLASVLVSVLAVPGSGAAEPAGVSAAPLGDKTLVVWVAASNLVQKGGSALTVDDGESHFDGIVFGELAAGKWMPGSDGFRRTEQRQDDWPVETVQGAGGRVQVAVTYRGREVVVYRNGAVAARYTMANPPQTFGPASVVVMGMRHLEQGDDAHFAGSIDDARVYATALDAEELAALRPNEASTRAPWAWWTFDDAAATERTGRFPAVRLAGGARVEGGALQLNGKSACLFAAATADQLAEIPGAFDSPVTAVETAASRRLREALLADPYRAGYHFVIPEGQAMPFDPNGAIYWKGRYHLFYIFQDERGHNWGHVSSTDLFHWRHHPTGLVSGMFSGNCFLNREGRPTMCYHQVGQGNALAVAMDDDLDTWKKLETNPITPVTRPGDPHHDHYRSWDPYGWLEGDTYYAIFGGERPAVAKSASMGGPWSYVGDLMANTVEGVSMREDVSCADFFTIGDQRMLLCISHRLGCRYYLGEWKNEQFHPKFHERMSWLDNSFFAPESLLDDRGRRIMWAWIFDGPGFKMRRSHGWSGTMSLPRVLSLDAEGRLLMNPPEEIERLRYRPRSATAGPLAAGQPRVLDAVVGNSLEIEAEFEPGDATECGLVVCRSPDGAEETRIGYDARLKQLKVDTRKSGRGPASKAVEAGPFELRPGEPLRLRVFVDKSVVEVFANGRQAVMRRVYPVRRDSVGVAAYAEGGAARLVKVSAWDMAPSNPY